MHQPCRSREGGFSAELHRAKRRNAGFRRNICAIRNGFPLWVRSVTDYGSCWTSSAVREVTEGLPTRTREAVRKLPADEALARTALEELLAGFGVLRDEIGLVVDEAQRASIARAAGVAAVVSRDALSEICRVPGVEFPIFQASQDVDVVHVLLSDEVRVGCRLRGPGPLKPALRARHGLVLQAHVSANCLGARKVRAARVPRASRKSGPCGPAHGTSPRGEAP